MREGSACNSGERVSSKRNERLNWCRRLTRGVVRQHETAMKTEASRKPVPMEMGLADVLKIWRMECGYSQPSDYIFASADMDGKQPLWPNSAMGPHPASGHSSRNNQTFGLAYASPYVRYFAEG